ncbi:MAG: hypothetical protein PHH60_05045 [Candidatus Margulisbacteria bacterium]|nr:hypothetical protein [Candidatus Margulisiibacteriota bacterium]
MKKLYVLVLVLLTAFVAGCSILQTHGSSEGGGASYFPLTQGYTWRYASSDGSTQISTIEGTATIGSITVQIMRSAYVFVSGSTITSESYYRVDSSGVYAHGSPSSPSSIGIPFLAFPLQVGKTWDVMISGSIANTAAVVAKEDVVTSIGTFNCYKVNYITKNGTVEMYNSNLWFGDNVGIVKGTSATSTIESELAWKSF